MQQIEESANYVGAVVEREISLAGNASKVAIAGFSHGGVVAMYTALTKLSQPLGCCVAVGGPPVLPQLLGRKIKPHLRDTPVHCLGGAAEEGYALDWSKLEKEDHPSTCPDVDFTEVTADVEVITSPYAWVGYCCSESGSPQRISGSLSVCLRLSEEALITSPYARGTQDDSIDVDRM